MLCGGQVLVHGPAVGDEAEAELEVARQAAVGGQGQHQQGRDQQETHHQQGHTAPIRQQVRAVAGGAVGTHLGREREKWRWRGGGGGER